jgi:hypothetical protein
MMRGFSDLRRILAAGLLLLLINLPAFASDLIEPTRTLSRPAESPGLLSVFSEPPELDVTIDGTRVGKTPVVNQKVEPGLHAVGVQDDETEIYVKPGKSMRLSWFKGAFVEIPAEAKAYRQPQFEEKKESPGIKTPEQPAEKKEKPYPLYWPLNPTGPIN